MPDAQPDYSELSLAEIDAEIIKLLQLTGEKQLRAEILKAELLQHNQVLLNLHNAKGKKASEASKAVVPEDLVVAENA